MAHGCSFNFKQQVISTDIADYRYTGPTELFFYFIEYLLNFGGFAVSHSPKGLESNLLPPSLVVQLQ
jgi:hypothetical protein